MQEKIPEYLNTLRELLPKLRSREIHAIEFGEPDDPMGFLSHHRIEIINTPAGPKFCFREVFRGMFGSGDYMDNATDRDIEIKAQNHLHRYYAPSPFKEMLKKRSGSYENTCTYFAILHE